MNIKKIPVLASMLVMMCGLVGCGTQFEKKAVHYDMFGGLLGPVGTVVSVGAAGVVTAVESVTPDSTPKKANGGEVEDVTTTKPGEI